MSATVCIASLTSGCGQDGDEAETAETSAPRKPDTDVIQISHHEADARAAVIEIWRNAAERHALPDEVVEQVTDLTADILDWTQVSPSGESLVAFESSLPRYLEQYGDILEHSQTRTGTAYWMAYCIGKAFERSNRSTPTTVTTEYFQGLVERAAVKIEKRVHTNLPDEQHKTMADLVDDGGRHLRKQCGQRLAFYTNDFLCPAFKRQLDSEQLIGFLDRYVPDRLPTFQEPLTMMVTADEDFRRRFRSYIENEIGQLLFDLFIRSLETHLNRTDYWGYMDYRANSVDDMLASETNWPAVIGFVPNPEYNELHRWQRSKGAQDE